MERLNHYAPTLNLFGILVFILGLLVLVPGHEWLSMLFYFPVIFLIARLLYQVGIKPIDPNFTAGFFLLTFVVKLLSSEVRYWMVVSLYEGGDSLDYHIWGQYAAQYLSQFDFSVLGSYQTQGAGTTSLTYITAFLYTVLPPSVPGSFFFFATLAFSGSVFFYRTFQVAFPKTDLSIYRLLIFFTPSIVFWPASLGKDAWLFFTSGMAAYGLVLFIRTARLSSLLLGGVGLFLANLVRPHIAVFMLMSVIVAYILVYRARTFKQFVGGMIIVLAAVFVFQANNENLLTKSLPELELSAEGLASFQEEVQRRTYKGGSSFTPVSPFGPVGFVYGLVTVLFRPFPWETHNPQMLLTSLESMVWLGLVWYRRETLWERLTGMVKDPWLVFVFLYSLVTILAFTSFANFGIIARQRVMVLPFVLMLIA